MGNKFIKRSNKYASSYNYKKSKSLKTSTPNLTNDEFEFKFILNEIVMPDENIIKSANIEEKFKLFKKLFLNRKLEQIDLLDAYYNELKHLTLNYAELDTNKIILKILCATCFTREQETECIKFYKNFKNYQEKEKLAELDDNDVLLNNQLINVDDLFISGLEGISINTCRLLLDYIVNKNDYEFEINKLFNRKYLYNCRDSTCDKESATLMRLPLDSQITSNNYLTILDSFIWKYLKQLSIYLHKNEFIIANELKLYLYDIILFMHELINYGFKMNNYVYGDHQQLVIDKYYNIMFLMYYNVNDLALFENKERVNLDLCLNMCLKEIIRVINVSGFRKTSDSYKTIFYYKLKKCAFQRWSGENKILIRDLIQTQTVKETYQPLKLGDFCRIQIRNMYPNAQINKLILPRRIIDYLQYKDEIEDDIDLYFQILY